MASQRCSRCAINYPAGAHSKCERCGEPTSLIQGDPHPNWQDLATETVAPPNDEIQEVFRRRYQEARKAGLSIVESQMYADSPSDVRWLRKLVADGCSPELMARILL